MTNRKNTNKNTSKFSFNVIDMLIILIIVVAAFFLVYCLILGNDISDLGAKNAEVEYSVIIPKADIIFKDSISVGDNVTDPKTGNSLGTVKKISYSVSFERVTDDDGNEKLYINPDKIDIAVTISCNAKTKNNKYRISGVILAIGKYIDVCFPDYAPSEKAYISDVNPDG